MSKRFLAEARPWAEAITSHGEEAVLKAREGVLKIADASATVDSP
jgi:hypothetical protein